MLYIFWALCGLIVLGFVISSKFDEGIFMSCIGIVGMPIVVVTSFFTYESHCNDLAIIRNSQSIIGVYTQAITDLDQQIEGLNKSVSSQLAFNADSPYRSLIEAKSRYVSKLSMARATVVQAETSIIARKLGLMSYIVRWVGEK
jgi:hypothetical protein